MRKWKPDRVAKYRCGHCGRVEWRAFDPGKRLPRCCDGYFGSCSFVMAISEGTMLVLDESPWPAAV